MGFNDNANTWGTVVNSQFTLFDKAIAGVSPIDVTGSVTVDLTTSVVDGGDNLSKRAVLKFTGIPTANTSITVPAVTKIYIVHSSLAANKTLFIHPAGSSVGVTVGQSDTAIVYCDGTDMLLVTRSFDSELALLKSGNLSSISNTSAALVNLGITASASELNVLDGITASTAELNYVHGVSANIQTQLNTHATSISSLNTAVANVSAQITSIGLSVNTSISGVYTLGGLRFQHGYSSAAINPQITFPVAFNGAPTNIQLTANMPGNTYSVNVDGTASAGGFQARTWSTATANTVAVAFYWSAVGPV